MRSRSRLGSSWSRLVRSESWFARFSSRSIRLGSWFVTSWSHLVRSDSFSLECNAWLAAEALAQRISSLASGDVFRHVG